MALANTRSVNQEGLTGFSIYRSIQNLLLKALVVRVPPKIPIDLFGVITGDARTATTKMIFSGRFEINGSEMTFLPCMASLK
jgi:hypothetical protein